MCFVVCCVDCCVQCLDCGREEEGSDAQVNYGNHPSEYGGDDNGGGCESPEVSSSTTVVESDC